MDTVGELEVKSLNKEKPHLHYLFEPLISINTSVWNIIYVIIICIYLELYLLREIGFIFYNGLLCLLQTGSVEDIRCNYVFMNPFYLVDSGEILISCIFRTFTQADRFATENGEGLIQSCYTQCTPV